MTDYGNSLLNAVSGFSLDIFDFDTALCPQAPSRLYDLPQKARIAFDPIIEGSPQERGFTPHLYQF